MRTHVSACRSGLDQRPHSWDGAICRFFAAPGYYLGDRGPHSRRACRSRSTIGDGGGATMARHEKTLPSWCEYFTSGHRSRGNGRFRVTILFNIFSIRTHPVTLLKCHPAKRRRGGKEGTEVNVLWRRYCGATRLFRQPFLSLCLTTTIFILKTACPQDETRRKNSGGAGTST